MRSSHSWLLSASATASMGSLLPPAATPSAPGSAQARIPVIAMHPGRRAVFHSTESAAGRRAGWDLPAAEITSVLLLLGCAAHRSPLSSASLIAGSARYVSRRQIRAIRSAVLIRQIPVGIRHALTMERIVAPGGVSVNVRQMGSVEIVPVDEVIVHDHGMATPTRPPAPAAPTSPSATEVGSDRNPESKSKKRSADEADAWIRIPPMWISKVDWRAPDEGRIVFGDIHNARVDRLYLDNRLAGIGRLDHPLLRRRGELPRLLCAGPH